MEADFSQSGQAYSSFAGIQGVLQIPGSPLQLFCKCVPPLPGGLEQLARPVKTQEALPQCSPTW